MGQASGMAIEGRLLDSCTRREFIGRSAGMLAGATLAGRGLAANPWSMRRTSVDASQGTFLLRIGFTGLSLFVPGAGTNPTVFVLMPKTQLPAPEQHRALLRTCYGEIPLNGVITLHGEPFGPGEWSDGNLPDVADLSPFSAGEKVGVPANLLGDPVDHLSPLQARIVVDAGCVVAHNRGAKWDSVGAHKIKRHLATFIVWGMRMAGPGLTLNTLTNNPGDSGKLLEPANGVVDVLMSNEPADPHDGRPEHFAEYRRIVRGFDGGHPTKYSDKNQCVRPVKCKFMNTKKLPPFAYAPACPRPGQVQERADFTTCMVAQAPVIAP